MFIRADFDAQNRKNAASQGQDASLRALATKMIVESERHGYWYQNSWLGQPIIQLPQDIVLLQELIWKNKPDVIIETGVAWGGSVILHASILHLIGKGRVVGVDLNLFDHIRDIIMGYNFSSRITLHKGSSTDPAIVDRIKRSIKPDESVMLILDSHHSHDHVLAELRAYGPTVTPGQSIIVCDTFTEQVPPSAERPRPWGPGNNPYSAMKQYMTETDRFERDDNTNDKALFTLFPEGYLRCVK